MIITHISFSLHRQSSTLNGTATLHQSSILSSSMTPSNPAITSSQSQSTTWPQDLSFLSFLAFAPVQVSLSTIFDLHSQVLSSSSLPSTTITSDTQINNNNHHHHHYHHIMHPLLAMELVKDLLSATEHLIHW